MADPGAVASIISPELKEIAEFARNIALIAIPFVLYFISRANEHRRATLDLIRNLETGGEIVERLERLFQRRIYEETKASDPGADLADPYEGFPEKFKFDSVIVLNYFEAACVEIENGAVDEELMFDSVRNTIIGAHDVVLQRYNDALGDNPSRAYTSLTSIAARWRTRIERYGLVNSTNIPNS